jgi:hypothetical protein
MATSSCKHTGLTRRARCRTDIESITYASKTSHRIRPVGMCSSVLKAAAACGLGTLVRKHADAMEGETPHLPAGASICNSPSCDT